MAQKSTTFFDSLLSWKSFSIWWRCEHGEEKWSSLLWRVNLETESNGPAAYMANWSPINCGWQQNNSYWRELYEQDWSLDLYPRKRVFIVVIIEHKTAWWSLPSSRNRTFQRLSRWSDFRPDFVSASIRILGIFRQFLCCRWTTCLEHICQIHLFNSFEVTFYRTELCFFKVKNSFVGSGNFSIHSPELPLFLLNKLQTVQPRKMPYIENLTDYKFLRQNGQVFIWLGILYLRPIH